MKWVLTILLGACFVADAQNAEEAPGRVAKAKPGQFRALAGDDPSGGALVLLAEEAKREFLELCRMDDSWSIPVEIRMQGMVGASVPEIPIRTKLVEVDGLRKFLLDVHTGKGVDQEQFRRTIYTLVIYDLSLREREIPEVPIVVNPWLTEGILEAIRWNQGQRDRGVYRAIFESGGVFRLDELLETTDAKHQRLDAASMVAFRVCSGVLVMAFLEQPEGEKNFQAFLREVALFQGEINVLLSRFLPGINLSQNGLEKLWSLQMANKGGLNSLTDVLDIQTSENLLEQSLHFTLRNAEGLEQRHPLSDWNLLLDLSKEERVQAIKHAESALVRVSYRCFPPYREILSEYQMILLSLAKGEQTNGVADRLHELASARKLLLEKSQQGRDYLDWFEITRADTMSGAFRSYSALRKQMRKEGARRDSSMSRYLEAMNKLFAR